MNVRQREIAEHTGYLVKDEKNLPEWLVLWAEFLDKVDTAFPKEGDGWSWIKDKELSTAVQKELDDLNAKYLQQISDMYHQYRKEHPEEFKPRENE